MSERTSVLRQLLGVLAGSLAGSLVFFASGIVAQVIAPTPPELMNPATPELVARRVAHTPLFSWLIVLTGFAVGSFVAGATGTWVARRRKVLVGVAIGLTLSIWAAYTFYVVYPERLWVPAVMLLCALVLPHVGGRSVASALRKHPE